MTPPFKPDLALGDDGEPVGNSTLDRGEIDLIPMSALRPELRDMQTSVWMASEKKQLLAVVQNSAKARAQKLAEQISSGTTTPIDVPMPQEFTALGRLAEPALARIREISGDRAVQVEADHLIA